MTHPRTTAAVMASVRSEEPFATLNRYWTDPDYRAELASERVTQQAALNARIDANIAAARARRQQETI